MFFVFNFFLRLFHRFSGLFFSIFAPVHILVAAGDLYVTAFLIFFIFYFLN